MGFMTGYWAKPGTDCDTKVHIAIDGKPYCGIKISKDMVFQWCANHVVGEYVRCEKCIENYKEHLKRSWISEYKDKTVLEVMTLYPTGFECVCNECGSYQEFEASFRIPETYECKKCGIEFLVEVHLSNLGD